LFTPGLEPAVRLHPRRGSQKSGGSAEEEVCIDVKIDDTFDVVDPVKLKIKVTSRTDVSELYVTILASGISIDGPETWEKSATPGYVGEGKIGRLCEIKSGQTLADLHPHPSFPH
jgi:hypothetical protein